VRKLFISYNKVGRKGLSSSKHNTTAHAPPHILHSTSVHSNISIAHCCSFCIPLLPRSVRPRNLRAHIVKPLSSEQHLTWHSHPFTLCGHRSTSPQPQIFPHTRRPPPSKNLDPNRSYETGQWTFIQFGPEKLQTYSDILEIPGTEFSQTEAIYRVCVEDKMKFITIRRALERILETEILLTILQIRICMLRARTGNRLLCVGLVPFIQLNCDKPDFPTRLLSGAATYAMKTISTVFSARSSRDWTSC
jgi:hypothetical protein